MPIDERARESDGGLPDERALDWLGPQERRELDRLRDTGRRQQWLAGRRLSKRLIEPLVDVDRVADIQILTRDGRGRGVRPRIVVDSRELQWTLSISHADRGVLVAVAPTNEISLGVDLAGEVPRGAAFARLWFTALERCWLNGDRGFPRRPRVLWALKEAVYKAANGGEPWNPRQIEVLSLASGGSRCMYRGRRLNPLALEVHDVDDCVAAIVCLPKRDLDMAPDEPTPVEIARCTGGRNLSKCCRPNHVMPRFSRNLS